MKSFVKVICTLCMGFLLGGCSILLMPESETPAELLPPPPSHGNFNDRMRELAEQLNKNAVGNNSSNTFIVTSFTNLDKLGDTTAFGRLIAENLMHGLQVHKWQILEMRLTKGIDVTPEGEFSLSRDVAKLKDEYKITGVVTGTFSLAEGNLTVNARIIDVSTGLLISSGQTYIPANGLPDASFSKPSSFGPMKIVSDGIK